MLDIDKELLDILFPEETVKFDKPGLCVDPVWGMNRGAVATLGSCVTIYDKRFKKYLTYTIRNDKPNNPYFVSSDSPLGKALIGHKFGDKITVKDEPEYEVIVIRVNNLGVTLIPPKPIIPSVPKTPTAAPHPSKQLIRNTSKGYGTRAQTIYDDCCKLFGWDSQQRYLFGTQQILYAKNATPEGYSPWFLPHNNWTATRGGNWFNKISGDLIEEMWLEEKIGLYRDGTTRVTFAKREGEYVFLGLYKPVTVETKILNHNIIDRHGKTIKRSGSKIWIKIYQSISDVYPM